MHFHRSLPLLASLVWIGSAALHAQIPYLETASLSFNRPFIETGIISTTTGPVRATPGASGPLKPDSVKPGDRITTDIGAPIYYTGGTLGDQTDWVVLSQRTVLERIAHQARARLRGFVGGQLVMIGNVEDEIEELKAEIPVTVDDVEREILQDQLVQANEQLALLEDSVREQSKALFKSDDELWELNALLTYAKNEFDDQGSRWELTAVRAPQNTVDGAARAPYSIFLTRIDRVRQNPTRSFDTGLSLNPFFAVGSPLEILNSDVVTRVTGTCTTHFEILLNGDTVEFVFASDPLHLVAKENLALAKSGIDYNTDLVRTMTFGSGYMTYSLRSTPGPVVAVTPTKIKITGHGTWTQWTERIDADEIGSRLNSRGGITPFALKMGESKFQSSTLFPEFASELP